jgi:hypothetical protein
LNLWLLIFGSASRFSSPFAGETDGTTMAEGVTSSDGADALGEALPPLAGDDVDLGVDLSFAAGVGDASAGVGDTDLVVCWAITIGFASPKKQTHKMRSIFIVIFLDICLH